MPLTAEDLLKLTSIIAPMQAKFTEYANDRVDIYVSNKKLSWRKEAIARTAIDALGFILARGARDGAGVGCPLPLHASRGNNVVIDETKVTVMHQAPPAYRFAAMPAGGQQLEKNVIYLNANGRYRYYGKWDEAQRRYLNQKDVYHYQYTVVDNNGAKKTDVFCWPNIFGSEPAFMANEQPDIEGFNDDKNREQILRFLQRWAAISLSPRTIREYAAEAFLDRYTSPVLLENSAELILNSLNDCYAAIKQVLMAVEAEHNQLNIQFGKVHIPLTCLDGTPAPGVAEGFFGFFSRTFFQSKLHALCRESWGLVAHSAEPSKSVSSTPLSEAGHFSPSRAPAPSTAKVIGTNVQLVVDDDGCFPGNKHL